MSFTHLLAATIAMASPSINNCPSMEAKENKILIDVGHSIDNGGARSARGVAEFQFNAALSLIIKEELNAAGLAVIEVGADGRMDSVRDRVPIINSSGAVFALSIHHDSVQPHYLKTWTFNNIESMYFDGFSGFSLFVSRKNKRLSESLYCAKTIGRELIRGGFHATAHHNEKIEGENRDWADQEYGVYYYDDLYVLKNSDMPAVLLEAGVIVNRSDELFLSDRSTRERIAKAVVRALYDCKIVQQEEQ